MNCPYGEALDLRYFSCGSTSPFESGEEPGRIDDLGTEMLPKRKEVSPVTSHEIVSRSFYGTLQDSIVRLIAFNHRGEFPGLNNDSSVPQHLKDLGHGFFFPTELTR